MEDLEPITRNEKLWSGEDLTPVTRKEMYIKHLYDETQVIPEYPVTREEMFILKAGEELHDVTVEQLSVTENGTYSEEGVAYSPVIVNVPAPVLDELTVTGNGTYTPPSGTDGYDEVTVDVPLPSNAYLLKEIEDVEIASFNDGSDLSMPKLEVAIEPVQEGSGDPSPENVRPIIGWDEVNVSVCGVNVWDEEWEVGDIDAQGNPTSSTTLIRAKNFNPCKPNTTYKVVIPSGASMYMKYYDKDKNFISPTVSAGSTITTPSNCYYFKFVMGSAYGTTYNNDISINYPSTDTSYHAYNGSTITLDLDGTRYGVKVDLVSGVMTVTHISIDLNNTNNWQLYNGGDYDMYYLDGAFNDISISEESLAHVICSKYPYSNDAFVKDAFRINTGKRLYVGDTRFVNDLSGFKESLTNGVQLVYELATPLTIQLTPTVVKSLRGMNNVFADCGNILDLSYLAKEE